MNFLLDTHLLLWAAAKPEALPKAALAVIEDPESKLWFSAASILEVAIKSGLGRTDFKADPSVFRAGLLSNGYHELEISGRHAVGVLGLPDLHSDPFDRMLVAQGRAEGLMLLTSDKRVADYGGSIRLV